MSDLPARPSGDDPKSPDHSARGAAKHPEQSARSRPPAREEARDDREEEDRRLQEYMSLLDQADDAREHRFQSSRHKTRERIRTIYNYAYPALLSARHRDVLFKKVACERKRAFTDDEVVDAAGCLYHRPSCFPLSDPEHRRVQQQVSEDVGIVKGMLNSGVEPRDLQKALLGGVHRFSANRQPSVTDTPGEDEKPASDFDEEEPDDVAGENDQESSEATASHDPCEVVLGQCRPLSVTWDDSDFPELLRLALREGLVGAILLPGPVIRGEDLKLYLVGFTYIDPEKIPQHLKPRLDELLERLRPQAIPDEFDWDS